MATDFAVLLPNNGPIRVEDALDALENLDSIESRLTIYRPTAKSPVPINVPPNEPVRLSSATFRTDRESNRMERTNRGRFDITAGPLVEAWGFTKRSGKKPTETEIESALRLVGYQHLEVVGQPNEPFALLSRNVDQFGRDRKRGRFGPDRRGTRSGGIADFLIHGGNSSVIAAGNQDPATDSDWAVGIAHPTKPRRRLGGIWLKDNGARNQRQRETVFSSSRQTIWACDRSPDGISGRRSVVVDRDDGVRGRCGRLCDRAVCDG